MMIIAADVGGTHSRWGLIEPQPEGGYHLLQEIKFNHAEFTDFYALLSEFINHCRIAATDIDRLSVALAGPIEQDSIQLTNIDWVIDRQQIDAQFGIADIHFINDLQAAALGTFSIDSHDLLVLNDPPIEALACRVVIGAGTGLGLAYLHQEGPVPHCYATEGGHGRFAPASDEQFRLQQFLQQKYGRVSYERIISGQGLVDLYAFAAEFEHPSVTAEWVSHQAATGKDPSALCALRLWTEVYGGFVGNMATLFNPRGGIFLVGGLSNKLSNWLISDTFYRAFIDQGRMQPRVDRIPLRLVANEQVGLLGAIAFSLLEIAQE